MPILLHGDNQVASRGQLASLVNLAKKKGQEIIRLDGLAVNLTETKQAFESPSFFAQEKLVVIEDFFSRQKSEEKEKILQYFLRRDGPLKGSVPIWVIFWEGKEISSATVKKLKSWQIKNFKTPAIIFKFLDSFYPGNEIKLLSLLGQCIPSASAEFVFYMLARRVNQLILAKELGKRGLKNLAGWQQGKLVSQAKKFTLEQLTTLYQKLLKIDIDIKTGQSLMKLAWHLDLLVAGL